MSNPNKDGSFRVSTRIMTAAAAMVIAQAANAVSLSFIDEAPSVSSGKWAAVTDPEYPSAGLYVLGIGNSIQRYNASSYMITGFSHGNAGGIFWGLGHRYTLSTVNPAVDGSITSLDFSLTSKKGTTDGVAVAAFLIQNGKYYRSQFYNQLAGDATPAEILGSSGLTPSAFGEFVGKAYDYATPANGSANFASNPDFSASGAPIQFGYLSHYDSSMQSGYSSGSTAYQMTQRFAMTFNIGAPVVGWAVNNSGDWNQNSNWTAGIPNGVDAVATFGNAISTPQTVFTNTAVTVGQIHFDNPHSYQITGQGTLNMDVSTGSGLINVVQGNHKINLPLVINDNTTASVAAGATLRISDPMTLMSGSALTKTGAGTMTIESTVTNAAPAAIVAAGGVVNAMTDLGTNTGLSVSGGTANLSSRQHISSLSVSGGVVKVAPGNVVVTKSLSVTGSGQIDLGTGKMVVDYNGFSPVDTVVGLVNSGSITSSQATADFKLAVGEASDIYGSFPAPFGGESVDADSVLVAYTVVGDADLSGTVDSIDFSLFTAYYGETSGARWTQGDFTGDGKVNTLDFNALAGHFGQSVPPAAALGSVVPEPASLSILAIAGMLAGRRRR